MWIEWIRLTVVTRNGHRSTPNQNDKIKHARHRLIIVIATQNTYLDYTDYNIYCTVAIVRAHIRTNRLYTRTHELHDTITHYCRFIYSTHNIEASRRKHLHLIHDITSTNTANHITHQRSGPSAPAKNQPTNIFKRLCSVRPVVTALFARTHVNIQKK